MKLPRLLDLITIALWAVTSLILVLAATGPAYIAHLYLHHDNPLLQQQVIMGFSIAVSLLLGLILLRQRRLPRVFRLLPIAVYGTVIACATLLLFMQFPHGPYTFVILPAIPGVALNYPISIGAALFITLAAWGSFETMFTAGRLRRLADVAWIISVLGSTAIVVIYLWWIGFAHALLHGPSII